MAFLLVAVWFMRGRRPSLDQEAARLAGCLADQDLGCLRSLLDRSEHPELTATQLDQLLLLGTSGIGVKQPVAVVTEQKPAETEMRGLSYYRITQSGDQIRRAPFSFLLAYTDKAVVSPGLLDRMFVHRWASSDDPIAAGSRAEAMMRRILAGIKSDRARLESLGLKVIQHARGPMDFDSLEAYYQDAIKKIQASR